MADITCIQEIIAKYIRRVPEHIAEDVMDAFERSKMIGDRTSFDKATINFNDEMKAILNELYEHRDATLRSILINNMREAELYSFTKRFSAAGFGRTEAEGFIAAMYGSPRPIPGARNSIASLTQSLTGKFRSAVAKPLDEIKDINGMPIWKKMDDPAFQLEMVEAKAKLPKLGNKRAHPILESDSAAVKVAKNWANNQKDMLDRKNAAGASIKEYGDFIGETYHDMHKISGNHKMIDSMKNVFKAVSKTGRAEITRAAREEWVEFIYPRLRYDRTFKRLRGNEDAVKTRLRQIWGDLSNGRHLLAHAESDVISTDLYADIAKKASQHRVLHFKDAKSWLEYDKKFGSGGNLVVSMLNEADKSAMNIAVMQRLGTMPEQTKNNIIKKIEVSAKTKEDVAAGMDDATRLLEAQFERKDITGGGLFGGGLRKIENAFAEATGKTRIPGNFTLAQMATTAMRLQNLSKLGRAMVSSIADVPLFDREINRMLGDNMRGYGEVVKSMYESLTNSAEKRQFAQMFGVGMDALNGSAVARFSLDDGIGGFLAKSQDRFFKWTLLQGWTDGNKIALAKIAAFELGQRSSKPWSRLTSGNDLSLKNMMKLYDIDEGKWNLMRKRVEIGPDGNTYLTPDAISKIADDEVAVHLGLDMRDPISANKIKRFKDEMEMNYRTMLSDRADFAVATPSGAERAFMLQGTQPGTVEGMLYRFFWQFKSFPVTVTNKLLVGDIKGVRAGGRGIGDTMQDIMTASKNPNFLGNYLGGLTTFGALALTGKDLLAGRTPRLFTLGDDPDTWEYTEYLMAAFVQGGAAGIYADLLLGRNASFGRGPLEAVSGPVIGTGADLLVNTIRTIQAIHPDKDIPWKSWTYFARNNNPLFPLNMWYTKSAADYLIWYSLLNAQDPNTLVDLEDRAHQDGRDFILQPSNYILPGQRR